MDLLSLEHKGRVRGVNLAPKTFLQEVGSMNYTEHPAVGYGTDYRFTGNNLVGSALVVADEVVHAAFSRIRTTHQRRCTPAAAVGGSSASVRQRPVCSYGSGVPGLRVCAHADNGTPSPANNVICDEPE